MDNKEDYIKRRMLEEQLDDNKKEVKNSKVLEEPIKNNIGAID